jgi:membrane associated rhomboid family serine protease
MSNIRGLNDPADNERRPINNNRASPSNIHSINDGGGPRNEKFCGTLKTVFCPSFEFMSFICMMSITQTCIFIITVFWGGLDDTGFLAPSLDTLITFGAKYPYLMRYSYEIWRFFTPLLLHADLLHLVANLIS